MSQNRAAPVNFMYRPSSRCPDCAYRLIRKPDLDTSYGRMEVEEIAVDENEVEILAVSHGVHDAQVATDRLLAFKAIYHLLFFSRLLYKSTVECRWFDYFS